MRRRWLYRCIGFSDNGGDDGDNGDGGYDGDDGDSDDGHDRDGDDDEEPKIYTRLSLTESCPLIQNGNVIRVTNGQRHGCLA